jgi:hypothetical protein
MRKNGLTIIPFCIAIFLFISTLFGEKSINLYTKEFGVTKSEPINSGFVFIKGQYLDAPYIVTRKGLAIFINDKMVALPERWPVEIPSGDVDPEIPPKINKDTSFYDDVLKKYLLEKTMYVQKHYTPEEERRIMEQVYRGLPCVKEAKLDDEYSDILHLTTFSGETIPAGLVSLRGRKVKHDKESVLQRVEATRKHFENNLKTGDCLIFSNGGRILIGGGNVTGRLPKLLKVLRSSKSTDEKFEAVQQSGFPYISKDSFPTIVTNFSASPQLEQRLNELIKKTQQKNSVK